MHIKDIDQIGYLATKLQELIDKRRESEATLNVLIGGRYQDQDFIEVVRPYVVDLITHQIVRIEDQLRGYGVTAD